MEHLFKSWRTFAADYRAAAHVLLLSDYDGTLTPIVARPPDARLPSGVRDKLAALTRGTRVSVGIISGRAMADLKSLVALEGLYYAGNHGLEIAGPGLNYVSPEAELARATVQDLAGRLAAALESTAGVIIEDKGLGLSVHYRLVARNEERSVKETFRRVTAPLAEAGKIKITSGKKILEVRPPLDWHKGKAVEAIRREIMSALKLKQVLTIFLGDDLTDEDAFKVLHRPGGWSVYIGGENRESAADYFLDSTAEVEELLDRLIKLG